MSKYKILAIFANHTTNIIKYNLTLNNLSFIKNNVTNIVFIDSKNEMYADKLYNDLEDDNKINNYFFIDNNNYYDFGKWIHVLKNINYSEYDYILLLNDSIIFNENINDYFIKLNSLNNIDLYGYNDSTQIKYHYQSYFFSISKNIVNNFINFFESRKHLIINLDSLVHNIELNICEITENRDSFIKIGLNENICKNLYWENIALYENLLNNNIFAIIKLKKIFDIQREYSIPIYDHNMQYFDPNFYRSYYNELNSLSDNELRNHFITIGQHEGRKYSNNFKVLLPNYYRNKLENIGLLYMFDVPDDFDIYYYLKNNEDINSLSLIDAIFHYINHGYYEGRTYNRDNNKKKYLSNNYLNILLKINYINNNYLEFDLTNFNYYQYSLSTNYLKNNGDIGILYHYLKNIIFNGCLFENIDCNVYRKIYPELNNIDNIQLIKHFIEHNKDNIYKIPKDFDHAFYKKIYKDLINLNDNELLTHYLSFGNKEGRQYKFPKDFNYDLYKKMYKDLSNLNNDDLEMHYIIFGIKENRIYKIPEDFNHTMYKKIYKDLNNLTNDELENHYLFYGIHENRIYKIPKDFNHNIYKTKYQDLNNLNNNELENHYLLYGFNENRIYKVPDDFNYEYYKKIYRDLNNLNEEELKNHYLLYGLNEKRIYKLPDDFNYNMYRNLNHDLSALNNNELKEHYLFNGIFEQRIYKSNKKDEDPKNNFIINKIEESSNYKYIKFNKKEETKNDTLKISKINGTKNDILKISKIDGAKNDPIKISKIDGAKNDPIKISKIDGTKNDPIKISKIDGTKNDPIKISKK